MPNITIGITGLLEFLGRDAGLKNPIWDPLNYWATAVTPGQSLQGSHIQSPLTSTSLSLLS